MSDHFSNRKSANRRRAPAFWIAVCAGWIFAACSAPLGAQSVWGLKPYRILVLTAFALEPEFTPRLQGDLMTGLVERNDAVVGAPWRMTVASARPGPAALQKEGEVLAGDLARKMLASLDSIAIESFPKKLYKKYDKIILMAITKGPDCSRVTVREFDTRTQLASTIVSREAWQLAKLRDVAFNTIRDAFAPLALIEHQPTKKLVTRQNCVVEFTGISPTRTKGSKHVLTERATIRLLDLQGNELQRVEIPPGAKITIRVKHNEKVEFEEDEIEAGKSKDICEWNETHLWLKASSLPPRDPSLKEVVTGDVFRPVIRFENRDGSLKTITPIQWSYLRVEELLGARVGCRLITGLRSPLAGRRRGRTQQLALAIVPPHEPSTLVLQTRTKQMEPKLRRYTTGQPAEGWQERFFDDSQWKQGLGAREKKKKKKGSKTASQEDTQSAWIRRTFTLDEIPNNPELTIRRVENAVVYINGKLAATVIENGMDSLTVPINLDALKALKVGELNDVKEKNVIAMHCWRTVSARYADVGIVQVLPGYDVFSHSPESPTTTLVGRSDWKGRVTVKPPAGNPIRVLLLKNGGALLARLPIVPGLQPVFVAEIPNDDARLEAEGVITGLQEELVDLVTQREIIMTRIKSRIEAEKFDKALELFAELDRLPKANNFSQKVKDEKESIIKKLDDTITAKKVERLFEDTEKAIQKFLGKEKVEALWNEYRQARDAKEGGGEEEEEE